MQSKSFFTCLKPKNQKGFLGLDTTGSLIVVMILTASAIAGVAQLIDNSKVNNMRNGLNSLNMGVRQLFVGGNDYTDLGADGTDMLIAAKIVPESLLNSAGDDILTPWGGDIDVAVATDTELFTITLKDVPQNACIKLASGNQTAWDSVGVGADGTTTVTNLASANTGCTDGGTMIFTAR